MTNTFFADSLAPPHPCAGPLGAYREGFGAQLAARGYARATATQQLRCVAHFSRWLARRRLEVDDIDERRGTEFVRARRRRGRVGRGDGAAVRTLLAHLRQIGVIPFRCPPARPRSGPRSSSGSAGTSLRSGACRARR